MYIGSTGELGLHHWCTKCVDNSVDESARRPTPTRSTSPSISTTRSRWWTTGRGIPVDNMDIDGEKVSAAASLMTHAARGGKFDSNSYKVSGGLHGVV